MPATRSCHRSFALLCLTASVASIAAAPARGADQPPIILPPSVQPPPVSQQPPAVLEAPTALQTPAVIQPLPKLPPNCLESGDGYFRARLGGAIDAKIDWPNNGTQCQGESKANPPGVRLSFHRVASRSPNLLFVLGITGIREGASARDTGANLTVIVQGTDRIYGTLGDSRCTVDSLTQRPLKTSGTYRVEARGFCTQPAHAVRGNDAVLMSTFEFAGLVTYER